MIKKENKSQKITKLNQRIRDLKSQVGSGLYFAHAALEDTKKRNSLSSGVVISLNFLGGKELFSPVLLCTGLSKETIELIQKDLKSSQEYNRQFTIK
jgi:hypothetical protein